jgi:DNA-directed RNA polymerase subunit RPC12/RpoP
MSEIVTYKCPNCGGPLTFDPEKQKYTCDYCLSEFVQKELDAIAPDTQKTEAQPLLYNCPSCGAEIVTDDTTAATFCYYCHNPVILSGRVSGEFHPDYVIPFSIDKEKALEIFQSWMKKKRYVPKAFYSQDQIEKVSGVYFPYLMYSCQADGRLDASADKLRVWVTGDYKYTETSSYSIHREGNMDIRYVPRNALKKANRELAEGVFSYDMEKLKPFQMSYLSGFLAERRDMEESEFSEEVKKEVREFAESTLRNSIGSYDRVRVNNRSVDFRQEKWDYALLPVWTLTYNDQAKNKIYYFSINGENGRVCGKLPVDMGRLMVLFAQIFFPILIVMLIVGYLI